MEACGIPWKPVEFHGSQWNYAECCRILQNPSLAGCLAQPWLLSPAQPALPGPAAQPSRGSQE